MFLLVPAYPGCPGQTAVKWLLLLLYNSGEKTLNVRNLLCVDSTLEGGVINLTFSVVNCGHFLL